METKAEMIRLVIKDNLRSEDNPTGLLTKKEADYLECFELKNRQLGELFEQDEAHWAENLEMIQRQANDIKDQIKALLEKQRLEFENMMRKSMSEVSLTPIPLEQEKPAIEAAAAN